MNQQQFESFTASSLYCDKCKTAMPVRERLLLVLPEREIFDYLCTGCGSSVGRREVTAGEKMLAPAMGGPRQRSSAGLHFAITSASASSFPVRAKSVWRR